MKYICCLCKEENELIGFGENICELCSESNIVLEPKKYENIRFCLERKMQNMSDQILAYSQNSYGDSHSVEMAKQKAVSLYRNVLSAFQFLVSDNNIVVNVDYENIKGCPDIMTSCQLNPNKVCIRCRDC